MLIYGPVIELISKRCSVAGPYRSIRPLRFANSPPEPVQWPEADELAPITALRGKGTKLDRRMLRARDRQCSSHPLSPSRESSMDESESEPGPISGTPSRVSLRAGWHYP